MVAIDSTCYDADRRSVYYGWRCGLKKSKMPKLSAVADVDNYLYQSAVANRGPFPDFREFPSAVRQAHSLNPFDELLADAGYDSEASHRLVREELGAESIIPPRHGRPTHKPPPRTQPYRRKMAQRFPKKKYNRRSHIETCFSQDKKRFGDRIHARNYWTQCRELLLRVLVHNIAILAAMLYCLFKDVFDRARCTGFR